MLLLPMLQHSILCSGKRLAAADAAAAAAVALLQ